MSPVSVIEDNSMFTGEHFKLEGVKDQASTDNEAKVYGAMGDLGWNPMEKGTVTKGLRDVMALWDGFFGPGTENWPAVVKYVDQCDIEERKDCGGPSFHSNAVV
jgi:acetyl esterase/lipase